MTYTLAQNFIDGPHCTYNNSNFEFIIFQYSRFNSYFKDIMTPLCITTIQSNFTARVHFKPVVAVYLIPNPPSALV